MKKKWITWALLVASLVLIGIGISQGQQTAVVAKAIRICLECVGIG